MTIKVQSKGGTMHMFTCAEEYKFEWHGKIFKVVKDKRTVYFMTDALSNIEIDE